jgi:hypothetical protein
MPAAIYLAKGNAHEEGQNRGCSGSTELTIVVSRRSSREISLWKAGDRQKERKEEQKEGTPVGPVRGCIQSAVRIRVLCGFPAMELVSAGPTTTVNSKLVSSSNPPWEGRLLSERMGSTLNQHMKNSGNFMSTSQSR